MPTWLKASPFVIYAGVGAVVAVAASPVSGFLVGDACHAGLDLTGHMVGNDGMIGGRHLCLDDVWQWGGVWRAEGIRDGVRPDAGMYRPLMPTGWGYRWTEAVTQVGDLPAPAMPGRTVNNIIDRSAHVPLTPADLALGRLRLGQVADLIPGDTAELRLVLDPDRGGPIDMMTVRFDRSARAIRDAPLPLELYPGLILTVSGHLGSPVVTTRPTPLRVPREVGRRGDRV